MSEQVRLVVWDLDETFWRGTLTEGGIREYIRDNHDIVIELAHRGIMSSICSKNDFDATMQILREYAIADYFVFPSISWETKAVRLAQLIENMQLRPGSVLFIDDNPNNLGEAKAVIPDIQIETEKFIPFILSDPRFKGKNDSELTRLAQYKLLEQKNSDAASSSENNHDFLRKCDVRIYIEYDIEANIDRAIELINRTNQLNYTKTRLPEDVEEARAQLRADVNKYSRQAGLVRVVDKYGDYGFVGFFLRENNYGAIKLIHYCFSCRTLGMLVEKFIYDFLGRPRLDVVGDVLTDLSVNTPIDWIRIVSSNDLSGPTVEANFPSIRMVGGCEANSISVYLAAHTKEIMVVGNAAAGGVFVRVNTAAHILSSSRRKRRGFVPSAAELMLPIDLIAADVFDGAPAGTLFVFNLSFDAGRWSTRYIHRDFGEELIIEPHAVWNVDFTKDSDAEILEKVKSGYVRPEHHAHLLKIASIFRKSYTKGWRASDDDYNKQLQDLINLTPANSKVIFLVDDHRVRTADGKIKVSEAIPAYLSMLKNFALAFPYVGVLSANEFIGDESEIQVGGNHYSRNVYLSIATGILELESRLAGRS